ncbi:restriction endonuclease [Streptococcus intermedius]|uniref:restriction endonuclease n=1 Tax=Streptococcus intermedius TaxID=1338 RepID=UPI000F66ADBB|nr:restriction endonuclease [Streptococcus intermedius]RSJ09664.1 hypothetical protein D8833_07435 [Streptococcus intermedius]RSJ16089.1 hypothetical protein D8831_05020 [Streptococcus intermedius]RSJ30838.1 hypothetical protein D8824_05020 [Streptococcus intermedius]
MNIEQFLSQFDYDIRKTNDARWIDQKCTYDVLSIIADCILEYVEDDLSKEFTVSDIWHNDYTRDNVLEIFSKPDTESERASNEYDKYFGQPIKLFGYSHILNVRKSGTRYFYQVNNQELLEYIALRPTNALNFLFLYIQKVLKDSGLYSEFEVFFESQDIDNYKRLRDVFICFTIENTPINGDMECGRIFTKILNPLSFKLKKKGTIGGRISKNRITLNDLQYNRINWRDELSGKEKTETRVEYSLTAEQHKALTKYSVNKAKRQVRRFNDKWHDGLSEIKQSTELVKATQVHHIFPQSAFPEIADYLENLIMITPNQHFSMAHPNNHTIYIDRDFQYICLLAKASRIMVNLTSQIEPDFYDFEDYKFVLNTGLKTDEFDVVNDLDFATIINKIDVHYSDCAGYDYLVADNKAVFS